MQKSWLLSRKAYSSVRHPDARMSRSSLSIGSGTDSGNGSPVSRPIDTKAPDFHLPQLPPNDSPHSSAPSTPVDHHAPKAGHRRTDSVNIEGDDYFLSIANFANGESTSLPGTPKSIAAVAARNISFSPRIQFHDTWPPGEYDRRGEIATCNRLTPMLAQQIKEELNTFKMVSIIACSYSTSIIVC